MVWSGSIVWIPFIMEKTENSVLDQRHICFISSVLHEVVVYQAHRRLERV